MFQLQRYFSLTSLIAFLIVSIALGYFYTRSATNNLLESAESNNVTLTHVFSNTLWPDYSDFAAHTSGLDADQLRAAPETNSLYEAVLNQMTNTSVIKVKVYNLEGNTIFSTDQNQIGEDKSNNAGVIAALNGEVISELTHRDTFDAFERTMSDLDVIASYISIQRDEDAPIEGVFEVYSDVTPLLQTIQDTRMTVIAVVAVMLTALYLLLSIIVRRAERILKRQHEDLLAIQAELQDERALLTQKVAEQTADLRQMNKELIHAAHLKDQFLAMISHELRTPLATILGRTETLLESIYGQVTDIQHSVLTGIHSGGIHLLGLVNDLIDVSRITMSDIEVELAPVSLPALCQDALAHINDICQKKRLRISFTMDEAVKNIEADERRLRQILINLLNNAAKFTPEGGLIGLDVGGDAVKQVVNLTVWDNGIGIPEKEQERIFEPFTQIDNRLSRKYDGAGLGLALVKHLTERHGGTVSLESTEGQGCRFIVSLPWSPVTDVVQDTVLSAETESQLVTSPLILIAEDNPANAETISDLLQYRGYRTILASNGYEAVEQTMSHDPDMILMDIQMPQLDGLEAIRSIRLQVTHHIPIIAFTGIMQTNARDNCIHAGADDFLAKPVTMDMLSTVLTQHLGADTPVC